MKSTGLFMGIVLQIMVTIYVLLKPFHVSMFFWEIINAIVIIILALSLNLLYIRTRRI
jgi:hypothetical protein